MALTMIFFFGIQNAQGQGATITHRAGE